MNAKPFHFYTVLILLGLIFSLSSGIPQVHAQTDPSSVEWVLDYGPTRSYVKAFSSYEGNLYAAGGGGGHTDGRIYRYDGTTWSDMDFASKIGNTVDLVEALQAFNGRLYIGARIDIGGNKIARVYYFDGMNFVEDFSTSGQWGFSGIERFVVHENSLYASNGARFGQVYRRDGDGDWSVVGNVIGSGLPVRTLASYNGGLYAGTGTSGDHAVVWRLVDNNWIPIKDLSSDYNLPQDAAYSLVPFNGKLYVGLMGQGSTSPIYSYDGTDWINEYTISGCGTAILGVIGNELWAGTCSGPIYRLQGPTPIPTAPVNTGIHVLVEFENYAYLGTCCDGRIYKSATPINTYKFSGFLQPVDNLPLLNTVKAGRAIPVKFSLQGYQEMNIFADGYPTSVVTTCGSTAQDAIEQTVMAGSSSLSYDASVDQYSYVWKTEAGWAGSCRTLVVKFKDGTLYRADFRFSK